MKHLNRPSLLLLALLLLAAGTVAGCTKDKGPEGSPYQVFN